MRLLGILASVCIWCVLLFVWAKAVFAQLQFWILTIWIYAISSFALSAGREVCEIKMLRKLQDEKIAEGKIEAEQVDEIELPAEEKSGAWKTALIAYSVATPLVLSSAIMYYVFADSMMKGQVCKFYELASDSNNQADCIANYDTNPDLYIEASGYRYTAF